MKSKSEPHRRRDHVEAKQTCSVSSGTYLHAIHFEGVTLQCDTLADEKRHTQRVVGTNMGSKILLTARVFMSLQQTAF